MSKPAFELGDRVRLKPYGTIRKDLYGRVWGRCNDGTGYRYGVDFDHPGMSAFDNCSFVATQLERENPLEALSFCGGTS